MFTLRGAPCYSRQLLTEYEDVIQSTLQHIMNVELSDDAWTQATLPVADGGFGIRRATDIALPAYLSSVAGSHVLISQLLPQRLHAISGKTIQNSQPQWANGSLEQSLRRFNSRFRQSRGSETNRM